MKLTKTTEKEIDNLMRILIEIEQYHKYDKYKKLSEVDWSEYDILSKLDHENDFRSDIRSLIREIEKLNAK